MNPYIWSDVIQISNGLDLKHLFCSALFFFLMNSNSEWLAQNPQLNNAAPIEGKKNEPSQFPLKCLKGLSGRVAYDQRITHYWDIPN